MKLQDQNAEVTLTAGQLEGLGKVGDTANQITDLLKMAQAALESMRDSIDIDGMADKIGPQVEALLQTLTELMHFVGIESAEDLQNSVHANLQAMETAKVREATPELINLVGALHASGLLKVLPPLLEQIGTLTADLDTEALGERLNSLNENLRYWTATAREGARIIGEQIVQMDLPDKIAVIEDIADQWWHIALRAKRLAQGDAENIGERVEWLLGQAEYWGGHLAVAVGTVRDLAPELLSEVDFGALGAKVGAGALEWIDIARMGTTLVKGDADSLAARVRTMLEGAREAGLDQMIPELMTMLGTVNRTGLLRKLNMVLTAAEPHMPADDQLKAWIEQGAVLAQRYQPQIAGALPALDATFKVMEGTEQKGGGIFGLLGIVFSRKTQYLLRFVVEFAYRLLRGNKD
ncbi:hypothetical protein [Acidihalobacter ferrooxydans]|uniref:Uncharacterized protein n=1 Tax=Acidihalobacter ferrooxydans TaxID=1765967 RepID=A0A1P8UGI0_9GAMM|nr:hypothetical protein [Acidihalobacter ferrooxydans]APZ42891.1 hypothetical protein BW247_07130 [Acidihalobacter ferrooxydans]